METQQQLPIDLKPVDTDTGGEEGWNIVAEADIVPFHATVMSSEPDPVAERLLQFEASGMQLAETMRQILALGITDQVTYDVAAQSLKQGDGFLKESGEYVEPIRLLTDGLHQKVLDTKKRIQSQVKEVLPAMKTALLVFDRKQEEIRRQLERAATERQRREEEEQRRQSAEAARTVGMDEASVQTILTAPSTTPAPSVPSTFRRAAGVSSRDNWCAEVTDLHALVKAVAKNKNLLPLLEANMPALNAQARAMKDALVIPGVRAVNKGSLAVRGGK